MHDFLLMLLGQVPDTVPSRREVKVKRWASIWHHRHALAQANEFDDCASGIQSCYAGASLKAIVHHAGWSGVASFLSKYFKPPLIELLESAKLIEAKQKNDCLGKSRAECPSVSKSRVKTDTAAILSHYCNKQIDHAGVWRRRTERRVGQRKFRPETKMTVLKDGRRRENRCKGSVEARKSSKKFCDGQRSAS